MLYVVNSSSDNFTRLHMLDGGVEGVEAELGLELGVFLAPCLSGGEVLAVRIRRLYFNSFGLC